MNDSNTGPYALIHVHGACIAAACSEEKYSGEGHSRQRFFSVGSGLVERGLMMSTAAVQLEPESLAVRLYGGGFDVLW
jgi:hypothetical protein